MDSAYVHIFAAASIYLFWESCRWMLLAWHPSDSRLFFCGATQNSHYIFDVSHLIRYAPHLLRGRWKLLGVYMPECTLEILWMDAAGVHLFVPGIL